MGLPGINRPILPEPFPSACHHVYRVHLAHFVAVMAVPFRHFIAIGSLFV
jgi:hypothetical protein